MSGRSIWDVLGIDPTTDTRTIKRAYARALKQSRPEDNAEQFQQLRYCYEWALHHAQHAQPETSEVLAPEPSLPTANSSLLDVSTHLNHVPDAPIASEAQADVSMVPVTGENRERERQIALRYARAAEQQQQLRREREQRTRLAGKLAQTLLDTPPRSPEALKALMDRDIRTLGDSFDSRDMYELALLRALAERQTLDWRLVEPIAEKFSWHDAQVKRSLLRADQDAATAVLRPLYAELQLRQWYQWCASDDLSKQVLLLLTAEALRFSDQCKRVRVDIKQRMRDIIHMMREETPELWWRVQQGEASQWWLAVLQKEDNNPVNRFKRWCATRDFYPINWLEWGVAMFAGIGVTLVLKTQHLFSNQASATGGLVGFVIMAIICFALNYGDAWLRANSKALKFFIVGLGVTTVLLIMLMQQSWPNFWALLVLCWSLYFVAVSVGGYWRQHGALLVNSWWLQLLLAFWSMVWAERLQRDVASEADVDVVFMFFWMLWPITSGLHWLFAGTHQEWRNSANLKTIWRYWFFAVAAIALAMPLLPNLANALLAPAALLLMQFGWSARSLSSQSRVQTIVFIVIALMFARTLDTAFVAVPSFARFVLVTMLIIAAIQGMAMGWEWQARRKAQAASV